MHERTVLQVGSKITLSVNQFDPLIQVLKKEGYDVVGPRLRDGAIIYDSLSSASDLPVGWTDEQEAGKYRLKKRNDPAYFGFTVGPHSWKRFMDPPSLKLWTAKKNGKSFDIKQESKSTPKYAFIGPRSCELHAMAIQDKVFTGGEYKNPFYQGVRENLFILAVNCAQSGNTCFCVSMNTGPKTREGFDLALTEIIEGESHYFVIEIGTSRGAEVMSRIAYETAKQDESQKAEAVVKKTALQMGRRLDTEGIKELLYRHYDNERWNEVANRCVSCANCTMVCPTCFCSTVEDVTDLTGEHAERWKKWDSCFTMDFSYIHGGNVRSSTKSRYRQWMVHKLASWQDQFGSSGCVGCGRCITWCPTAIDITEEARAIRESDKKGASS